MDPRAKSRVEILTEYQKQKQYDAGGLSLEPPKQPHVHVALKRLEQAVLAAENAWGMLRSRLEPVTFDGPDDPPANKNAETRQALNSSLARQIDGIADRVELLGVGISEVERKLEL